MMIWSWCFNVSGWDIQATTENEEWAQYVSKVQPEERARIAKFRFPIDAKRALAGRLLIRRLCLEALGITTNEDLVLARTATGKPYVLKPDQSTTKFNFNLSHHGEWVVLVGHTDVQVGVDVMEYEKPKGCNSLEEYFDIMKDNFTADEWSEIRKDETEELRLQMFYKFWSLKESYLKATGVGIGFGLQRASFQINREANRAVLYLDGQLQKDFHFSIQSLDTRHCVGIAIQTQDPTLADQLFPLQFQHQQP